MRWLGAVRPRRRWDAAWRAARALSTDSAAPLEADRDAPTLEAVDALRPAPLATARARRPTLEALQAQWARTYERVHDAFTRPQLYELARAADLAGLRRTMPKSQLVQAILEQRFDMTDPAQITSPTRAFVELPLSDAFLLTQRAGALARAARAAGAAATLGTAGTQPGVSIEGPARAVERVRAWLTSFQEHTTSAPLCAPDALPWLMQRAHCHISLDGETWTYRYVDAEHAEHAYLLACASAAQPTFSWRDVWTYASRADLRIASMPFVPGSAPDAAVQHGTSMGSWSRVVGAEVAPTRAMYAPALGVPGDAAEALRDELEQAPPVLDAQLVSGAWTMGLALQFGHALWHDAPLAATRALTDDMPGAGVFVAGVPPSAMGDIMLPGWAQVTTTEQVYERVVYRGTTPHGALELILHLGVDPSGPRVASAHWRRTLDAYVLCPGAPCDVVVQARMDAPASVDALGASALGAAVAPWPATAPLDSDLGGLDAAGEPVVPPMAELPWHVMLGPPSAPVALQLWRRESVDRRAAVWQSTVGESLHVLHDAVRGPSMPHYVPTVHAVWPSWPTDYAAVLDALLAGAYAHLGRQDA